MKLVEIKGSEYGLPETKAKELSAFFKPMLDTMESYEAEFNEILKLEITPETCKKAHALRNRYVKTRTGTAKIHKDLKAFYLQGGRFIDGFKNAQIMASTGKEEKLMNIANHFEIIEQARLEKLQKERVLILSEFVEDADERSLSGMEPDVWEAYLTAKEKHYNDELEAHTKAIEDAIKKDKAEKEALKQQQIENEKLEKARQLKEQKLKAEKDKAEAEAKRLQDIINAKAESERIAKAKEAAALKAKQDAEQKAKQIQEQKELQEKKAAAKLSAAPIKNQLNAWIATFEIPETEIQNAQTALIKKTFGDFKKWANKQIETI